MRQSRILTATLYSYVEPSNASFAKAEGRRKWGSFSNYINYLIARDKGDKASQKRSTELAKASFEPSLVKERKPVKVKPKKAAKKAARKASKKSTKKVARRARVAKTETTSAPEAQAA